MKHTQAPWKVSEVLSDRHNIALVNIGEGQKILGHINRGEDGEGEANAKLIAAAPELLEALQNIIDYHNRCAKNNDPVLSPHWEGIVIRAIKKAIE